MRTPPQRREDGKFGVGEPANVAEKKRDTRFQKGSPKPPTSGRKKGTPNKLSATVRDRLEAMGCDPIEGLALMAMDPKEHPSTRSWCYGKLLDHTYSKPAQKIDMSHKIDPEVFASKVKWAQDALVRAKQEREAQRMMPRKLTPAEPVEGQT